MLMALCWLQHGGARRPPTQTCVRAMAGPDLLSWHWMLAAGGLQKQFALCGCWPELVSVPSRASSKLQRRWTNILAVAAQRAFAESLLDTGVRSGGADGD